MPSHLLLYSGAGDGTRTHTVLLPTDFESASSTIPYTPAYRIGGTSAPPTQIKFRFDVQIHPQTRLICNYSLHFVAVLT